MNYKADSAFRKDILDINVSGFFNESTHDAEAARLAKEGNSLIVSQNSKTLQSVKQCVDSIGKELLKVRENYDFATNNTFKAELATLINKIGSVKEMWLFREIDTSTLTSFTDADADTFLKVAMREYLSAYSVFAAKYKAR
jgi:hypothetical protein